LRRGGVSYSIDTLREMQSANQHAEWFLLIGADSLRDFERWKDPAEILGRAALVVARRGGEPEPDWSSLSKLIEPTGVEAIRARRLDLPAIEISSSDIRKRVQTGRSIRYLLPPAVETYIREQHLWQELEGAS
jgi:nicotinate-nucleotide adenylyltransferase